MMQIRPILITSIAFTFAAVAMWAIAVTWAVTSDTLPLGGPAAAALSVIAALCWLELRRMSRDRDKALLIRTLADAVPVVPAPRRHPLAHTIPMLRAL